MKDGKTFWKGRDESAMCLGLDLLFEGKSRNEGGPQTQPSQTYAIPLFDAMSACWHQSAQGTLHPFLNLSLCFSGTPHPLFKDLVQHPPPLETFPAHPNLLFLIYFLIVLKYS